MTLAINFTFIILLCKFSFLQKKKIQTQPLHCGTEKQRIEIVIEKKAARKMLLKLTLDIIDRKDREKSWLQSLRVKEMGRNPKTSSKASSHICLHPFCDKLIGVEVLALLTFE